MKALVKIMSALTVVLFASASAHALVITPSTEGVVSRNLGNSNCEPGCIRDVFGLDSMDPLTLLYKADVGDEDNPATTESGTFASSYGTTFFDTPLDPNDALIKHVVGTLAIDCNSCYLAIKDGNNSPSYYFIDLTNRWNGTDDLDIQDFWPGNGAISHVSIWGGAPGDCTINCGPDRDLPEPGTLALVGLAIAGFGVSRRIRRG